MPVTDPLAQQTINFARLIIVMGVSGCGKSTVGAALAGRFGKPFLDADDYHPPANVEKMSQGIPLSDADRWPWLDQLAEALRVAADEAGMSIAACSALRRAYRQRLVNAAGEPILFVFLHGSRDIIAKRMAARTDHFMPTELLDSQFATLEPPTANENALVLNIDASVATLAETIYARLTAENIHRSK